MNQNHFGFSSVALVITTAMTLGESLPAEADTFSNATPITIPASGTSGTGDGPAAPYPSVITVAGIAANEVVSELTVTLVDFSHVFPDDVDVMLVGPNGVRVLLMSDTGRHFEVTSIDLTFDDDAADSLPDETVIAEGTYRPTNYGPPGDPFPVPAPGGPYEALLAAFDDLQPNGDWSLYAFDDAEFDVGTIAGGWILNITTFATTCGNNVTEPGEDCDDGDVEGGDGCGPTCLFEVCGNGYVDPGEDCDDGNTTADDGCNFTCDAEFCGDNIIQAGLGETCDDGNAEAGDGCGPVCLFEECGNSYLDPGEECDDGNTVGCDGCHTCEFVGPPFCNQASITIPAAPGTGAGGPADPYPSVIRVIGIPEGHVVSGLTVTLMDFSHTNPDDVDMLLVAPDGTNVFLMSDAGGSTNVVDIDLTFADGAGQVPDNTAIASGTYAPTNHGTPDAFPAPAPASPYGVLLSAYIGSNPNGNWRLYGLDDSGNFELGSIAGGWTLNLSTAFAECGNGSVEPGEGCDDGNLTGGDGCSPLCDSEICGNGIVDPDENCDDANTVACDGCANCVVEAPAVCGNGVPECGEDCDDANASETDGCLANCQQGAAVPPAPTGCFTVAHVFETTGTPISISAFGTPTVTSTIPVAGADPYIWDVNVTTKITHTANGDLDITLTSPSGTSVTLTTDNGGANDDVFNGTTWDDQADFRYAGEFAGFRLAAAVGYSDGETEEFLAPEEPLSAFDGEDPNGNWILSVSDDSDFNGGDLQGWNLSIATLQFAPTVLVQVTGSSAPGLAIGPGVGVVTDTITITDAEGAISDIAVTTNVTHTLAADLDIFLISPNGTEVMLTTDNGGPNDDVFAGTTWRDDADPGNSAPYATPNPASNLVTDTAYTNLVAKTTLAPEEPLSVFVGENPNGTWTIRVRDDANPNGGTLNSWSLTITTASCGEPQELCELPSGNGSEDDPCFGRRAADCVGDGKDFCRPIEAGFDGNDIFASRCDCFLVEGDTCGPVGISGSYISCNGPCSPGECKLFENENPLKVSELHIGHITMLAVYSCGCVEPLSGDLDGDGDVDLKDLGVLYNCFGQVVSSGCVSADLDNNGVVDEADFQMLQQHMTGPGF